MLMKTMDIGFWPARFRVAYAKKPTDSNGIKQMGT